MKIISDDELIVRAHATFRKEGSGSIRMLCKTHPVSERRATAVVRDFVRAGFLGLPKNSKKQFTYYPDAAGKPKGPLPVDPVCSTLEERLDDELKGLRKYNKDLRKEIMRRDACFEALKGGLAALRTPEPPKPPSYQKTDRQEERAILEFSDLHFGEKVDRVETGFADFNYGVCVQEMEQLKRSIAHLVDMHRRIRPVNTLHVFGLGDWITGQNIFAGQSWRVDMHVIAQVLKAWQDVTCFLNWLTTVFEYVEIDAVAGNHGEIRAGEPPPWAANFDYLIYQMCAESHKANPRITWRIPERWWTVVDVLGWKYYLNHGKGYGKRYMRFPWYGIETADNRNQKVLRKIKELDGVEYPKGVLYDYTCLGHNHTPFAWSHYRCNGAFTFGNIYTMKELQEAGDPKQVYFHTHPDHGAVAWYELNLRSQEPCPEESSISQDQ